MQAPTPTITPADVPGDVTLAMEVTGWPRDVVYRRTRQGLLPHVRVGRRVFYVRSQILAWIASGGAALPAREA